jgi:hypothetical protein
MPCQPWKRVAITHSIRSWERISTSFGTLADGIGRKWGASVVLVYGVFSLLTPLAFQCTCRNVASDRDPFDGVGWALGIGRIGQSWDR